MLYIKVDPSCLISTQSLEYLIATIKNNAQCTAYVTVTHGVFKNINTILQAAKMQDSLAYTLLRSTVLEYRNIFGNTPNIEAKMETFYHEIEHLVKFVEISSEYTQNLVNIMLERFSRLTLSLLQHCINGKVQFVQYYTKEGSVEICVASKSKILLLKHRKHIYNIENKYIKNPKIVKDLSYRDILESPALNFNGLSKKEVTQFNIHNAQVEIIEIETGEVETTINPNSNAGGDIKFATCVPNIAVITINSAKNLDCIKMLSEIILFMHNNNVEVLFTSQPSAGSSVSFGLCETHVNAVKKYIDERFYADISSGICGYGILAGQSMISVIGNGMVGKTGTAGRLFSHLGKQKINISTIAQNAWEVNISFTVDGTKTHLVMTEINKICFHQRKHVSLLLFGYGNIARGLVKMLQKQQKYLTEQGISISINLITNSKSFIVDENAQGLHLCEKFESKPQHYGKIEEILHAIESCEMLNPILVDLTSSQELAKHYTWFIKRNIHIASASKKANSLPYEEYKHIHSLCGKNATHFLYEANVGAGLPVVATIQDMLNSGDALIKCEGVLSGTLSYIFNNYDGTKPFSDVVKNAQTQGFTEPDPRDDLCGADAARKLLIIARMFGYKMNYEDVTVESLVPQELEGGKYDDSFFEKYKKYDGKMQEMLENAKKEGKVLRYSCSLENGKAAAKVVSVKIASPLGSIRETDNIIAFTTQYYNKTPIVIQGAGAGIDVTAMAVLSDIIKIFKYTQV